MKRITIVFLLMCMSLSAMASDTSVLNAEGVEIWYDFDSSAKTASVTSHAYTGEVVIPSTVTYEGVVYSVTSIGDYAFQGCWALTSITLPDGLTSIGNYAFSSCSSLTSITLPDGLTSIGDYAFSYCFSLTSITLPDGLTSIGDNAFQMCSSLTSITLPDGLTSIGDGTFSLCYALTSITLPDGLTSIGNLAFQGCWALTSITLPDGLTSIGNYAFSSCSSLTSITLPDGLTSIGNFAFEACYRLYEVYNKSDLTITAGSLDNGYVACYAKNVFTDSEGESKLKTEGDYIFYVDGEDIELIAYTGNETSITLPSDYEGKSYNIGNYAFYNCSSLTSITLPDGLTSIGNYAFSFCDSLTSITLPDGLTSIGDCTFQGCFALTSITLPDGLTSVENFAFEDCFSLTSITLPDGLTSIGDYAFKGCYALTSITLPDGLTSIGDYAFWGCYALTSITLPDGLTSIGDYAFEGCYRLYEVYNKSDLTITAGSSDNGYVAWYAKKVFTYSEGESKLKTEGDYIFYVDGEDIELIAYTGNETSITLPSDYEGKSYNIGNSAFRDCYALTSITLPDGLTSIGDYAFQGCWALTSITLPDGLTSIGDSTFSNCYALTSITLPDGLTSIGDYAFKACFALTSITLPDGLTSIGDYAFHRCDALTSITSKNITPPTVGNGYTFDGVNKSIPVYVPAESVETYKSAYGWSEFTNIQAIDETASSIIDSTTDSITVRINGNEIVVEGTDNYTVYSIAGQSLGKVVSVEKGIYIVVVNGKSYKVIAK